MIYLIQANIGLILFYAFYKLMCTRDTFFASRRTILILSLVAPFIIPLIDISGWMESHDSMIILTDFYYSAVLPEITIDAPESGTGNAPSVISQWIGYIYLTGIVVLSIRLVIQAASLAALIMKSPWITINGIRVKNLEKPSGPFSFFNWIFINKETIKEDEINEVLIHELTHARQRHSIDVILAEAINIACWINPFAWLLEMEVRQNLEFLADRKVMQSGVEMKSYQYHLLGLACKPRHGLANNFNISNLKQRIVMMNKKKTNGAGRIKYALFAIPAFALLVAGNISCTSKAEKKDEVKEPTTIVKPDVEEVPIQKPVEDDVFMVVEQMPEFPGGMQELIKFLGDNVKYPKSAQERKVQGRVIVQFVVEKDGTPTGFKVLRPVDPDLDAEALRVLGEMPKWKPGMQRGQAVRVKFTIPVAFKLQ